MTGRELDSNDNDKEPKRHISHVDNDVIWAIAVGHHRMRQGMEGTISRGGR